MSAAYNLGVTGNLNNHAQVQIGVRMENYMTYVSVFFSIFAAFLVSTLLCPVMIYDS